MEIPFEAGVVTETWHMEYRVLARPRLSISANQGKEMIHIIDRAARDLVLSLLFGLYVCVWYRDIHFFVSVSLEHRRVSVSTHFFFLRMFRCSFLRSFSKHHISVFHKAHSRNATETQCDPHAVPATLYTDKAGSAPSKSSRIPKPLSKPV
jgi:hypothetical protein